jgi:hypothetical protein
MRQTIKDGANENVWSLNATTHNRSPTGVADLNFCGSGVHLKGTAEKGATGAARSGKNKSGLMGLRAYIPEMHAQVHTIVDGHEILNQIGEDN